MLAFSFCRASASNSARLGKRAGAYSWLLKRQASGPDKSHRPSMVHSGDPTCLSRAALIPLQCNIGLLACETIAEECSPSIYQPGEIDEIATFCSDHARVLALFVLDLLSQKSECCIVR